MSEVYTIERLRDWCTCAGTSPCRECANQVRHIADEIQAEVDSRFMELPVDADGVPICVGDTLKLCYREEVHSLIYDGDCWYFSDSDGNHFKAHGWSHVKPRTLVDVLHDCCNEWNQHLGKDWEQGVYAKYADEIRELLGGDGE